MSASIETRRGIVITTACGPLDPRDGRLIRIETHAGPTFIAANLTRTEALYLARQLLSRVAEALP